jgi:hypothetical protein
MNTEISGAKFYKVTKVFDSCLSSSLPDTSGITCPRDSAMVTFRTQADSSSGPSPIAAASGGCECRDS